MGVHVSKSKTVVDNVVKAGISVVTSQVINSAIKTENYQEIVIDGCSGVDIKDITMKQFLQFNFNQLATQMASTQMSSDVQSAVKAAAEAEVKNAFGAGGSVSESIVNALMDISQAIINSAIYTFTETHDMKQSIICTNSTNVKLAHIVMDQAETVLTRSIVNQQTFNSAIQKIVNKIDAISSAKTQGYDPIGSIALLSIAFVVVALGVITTGGIGGISMFKNMISSPYFWMAVLSLFALMDVALMFMSIPKTWPYQKVTTLDMDEAADRKGKTNTAILACSGVTLAALIAGIGGIAYFTFRRHRRQ